MTAMNRVIASLPIGQLAGQFFSIEFPEYQREPNVWSLEQKQRLIDSLFRSFDISAIYMYEREDGAWECIDGRQRLNAIMSFLGRNGGDTEHDGFAVAISNEIVADEDDDLRRMDGCTLADLIELARDDSELADRIGSLLNYPLTIVKLSGVRSAEEFNLQFLRLNLGTLINAGEKLHAMVGELRDLIFEEGGLGNHAFLLRASVPTRRFAIQQIAAQLLLQAATLHRRGSFTRARHVDLQRFFKEQFTLDRDVRTVAEELRSVLDTLEEAGDDWAGLLKNRAITVSLVLLAWVIDREEGLDAKTFASFTRLFVARLNAKAAAMRELDPEVQSSQVYLIDFQRHVTQAAVERYAVEQRHEILRRQFRVYRETGRLES